MIMIMIIIIITLLKSQASSLAPASSETNRGDTSMFARLRYLS